MAGMKSDDEYPELREEEGQIAREIGKLLVERIRTSRWNQEELARKLGYPGGKKQFSNWKSGRNKITAAKLGLAANLLGSSVASFFPGNKKPTTLGDKMEAHLRRGEIRELLEVIAENLPKNSSEE